MAKHRVGAPPSTHPRRRRSHATRIPVRLKVSDENAAWRGADRLGEVPMDQHGAGLGLLDILQDNQDAGGPQSSATPTRNREIECWNPVGPQSGTKVRAPSPTS